MQKERGQQDAVGSVQVVDDPGWLMMNDADLWVPSVGSFFVHVANKRK